MSAHRYAVPIGFLSLLACTVLTSAPALAAEASVGVATLVEGTTWLQRGAELFTVDPGLTLNKADVIETAEKSFAQLEFDDGTLVALGSASRLLIFDYLTPVPPKKDRLQVVLLRGWMKVAFAAKLNEKGDLAQLSSRELLTSTARATVVFHVESSGTELFVESGSLTAAPLEPRLKTSTVNEGQFARRAANTEVTVASALPGSFLTAMPRAFRDPLFALRPKVKQNPPPTLVRKVTYDDVSDLLTLPGRWRRGMVRRFEVRIDDVEFRRSLDKNMLRHPEWDRILHPENYEELDQPPASTQPIKNLPADKEKSQ